MIVDRGVVIGDHPDIWGDGHEFGLLVIDLWHVGVGIPMNSSGAARQP